MNELMNFKTKADLWWQERRGFLRGIFKNPLFFALGVRVYQPDSQTVHLRLPWTKTQKILASEIPMSLVIGCAEMALQLHIRQFQIFAPTNMQIVGAELELPRPIDQAIEIRIKSSWPEWEQLRLELASVEKLERDFVMPLWNQGNRTLGTVIIHTVLQSSRLLPPSRNN
jgi:hypothetical protein